MRGFSRHRVASGPSDGADLHHHGRSGSAAGKIFGAAPRWSAGTTKQRRRSRAYWNAVHTLRFGPHRPRSSIVRQTARPAARPAVLSRATPLCASPRKRTSQATRIGRQARARIPAVATGRVPQGLGIRWRDAFQFGVYEHPGSKAASLAMTSTHPESTGVSRRIRYANNCGSGKSNSDSNARCSVSGAEA
jgi:hypothetical protein